MATTRRGFLKNAGLLGLGMSYFGLAGVLSGCVSREPVHVWAPKAGAILPGQPGFLDIQNLDLWVNRYYGAKPYLDEVVPDSELQINKYDEVIKNSKGIRIVLFTKDSKIGLRQAISLSNASIANKVPFNVIYTAWNMGNFPTVNSIINQESKEVDGIDDISSYKLIGSPPYRDGRNIFPVTFFIKDGHVKDIFWYEIQDNDGIKQNSIITNYATKQLINNNQYKSVLRCRQVGDLSRDRALQKVISVDETAQ